MPLSDVRALVFGPSSPTFMASTARGIRLSRFDPVMADLTEMPWRCFSLITAKRSVDFVAFDDRVAEQWVRGLQYLIRDRLMQSGALPLTKGAILFRRLRWRVRLAVRCSLLVADVAF